MEGSKLHQQKQLIRDAIKKAGSYRKLVKKTGIPQSSFCNYLNGQILTEKRFKILLDFLNIKESEDLIVERLPDNWKQVLGGKRCVELKKKNGTFNAEMKRWQKHQSDKLREWHSYMKENNPKEYYLLQYSRFKKVGKYKFITERGEKVRNLLEKQVADMLFKLGINYEYEPLINIGEKYFFPDFLVNKKIIIECTMWRGVQKAYKLRDKIEVLKDRYNVFVVIPKSLYSYYEILEHHLVLGLDGLAPIAQTFPSPKGEEGSNR